MSLKVVTRLLQFILAHFPISFYFLPLQPFWGPSTNDVTHVSMVIIEFCTVLKKIIEFAYESIFRSFHKNFKFLWRTIWIATKSLVKIEASFPGEPEQN